jgi:tungstate transport system substrate-binding protein
MDLWKAAGLKPEGAWYTVFEKGATGNGPTLRHTNEKKAYTVIDRATYLSLQKEIALAAIIRDFGKQKFGAPLFFPNSDEWKKAQAGK